MDDRIKPSMTVSTDIITNSKDGVLTLPTSAIKRDSTGYYVESDGSVGSMPGARNGEGTTTRRFLRASSTGEGGAVRNNFGSTTRQMETATIPSTTVLTKIPITIGMQGGSVTEILEGLTEGQRVIVKKTNVTAANKTAPSVTSLLRPGGTAGRTGSTASATTRPQ
jgi:multidrug efflux pump subunit AcrA (membrane-fusion protein)